jgi:hypothetical protein
MAASVRTRRSGAAWLVDAAGTAITAAVTVSSGAVPSAPASSVPSGGGY